MTRVDLLREVSGEDLISACLSAAEDFGWKGAPQDNYRKRYSLGSVHEHQDYVDTEISVKGRFGLLKRRLPAVSIGDINKKGKQKCFYIWTGFFRGRASEDQVQAYLSKISEHLGFEDQREATA